MNCQMPNGTGLKIFYPAKKPTGEELPQIIACLLKRCNGLDEMADAGEHCQSGLASGTRFTFALNAGQRLAYGK